MMASTTVKGVPAADSVTSTASGASPADFRDYFSSLDHQWQEQFVEYRVGDGRVLRLIRKWLAAGVIEEGSWTAFVDGVPQAASASLLLASVYLHYVFDLWTDQW